MGASHRLDATPTHSLKIQLSKARTLYGIEVQRREVPADSPSYNERFFRSARNPDRVARIPSAGPTRAYL